MNIRGLCIFELESNPKILLGCGMYELARCWGDQIRWVDQEDDDCYLCLDHQDEYFRLMIERALLSGLVVFSRKLRKDKLSIYYYKPTSLGFKESDLDRSNYWASQFSVTV